MFKVGDRVRVLRNRVDAWAPTEVRELKPGEIVRVSLIAIEHFTPPGAIFYRVHHSNMYSNYIPMRDIELVSDVCTCSVVDLILGSCVCGAS